MKKCILIYFASLFLILSCDSGDDDTRSSGNNSETTSKEITCGFYNGKQLWTGPQRGCYYYNSNQNKTYVDRSEYKC